MIAGDAMPTQPVAPRPRPAAPGWAPFLVALVVGLGVAAFAVGIAPITYEHDPTPPICRPSGDTGVGAGDICIDETGTDTRRQECGSLFAPNLVSTSWVDECAAALAPLRITEGLLTAGTIVLAILGAKRSGSIGRQHTRAWDAFLVGGVFAAFLAGWALAAWAVSYVLAWEPS